MSPTTVITNEQDLRNYFDAGGRPRERWGVGIEYERFGVLRDTLEPLPYEGPVSVESLLQALVRECGWTPDEEAGRVIGVSRGSIRITLEPGGQVELSGGGPLHSRRGT